ncbi:MAG: phosphoglucosamine mutase [Candidatus Iainarchaeum archaeon]|uniref:Phosphoglucosamine mutase n=1 Tax=Candidatus Iainarchaeum sp. TaxID=3101447 RepID=A0A497JJL2_9ARCH|nr:MAG: phosphoglucosamine mutase [Candidatus Diapherotrites archaeon]
MERKLFGTDGIRGKANEYPMTPEIALRLGKALATYLRKKKPSKKIKILIGKDTRLSGYMLESALESGIVAMGADVYLVGPMPTPAIAHLTKSINADAGIVISASHNPAQDNGIKIFDENGFKLTDEEEYKIEQLIFAEEINGRNIGKAFRIDDAKGRYIEFAKATINNQSLEGIKIVLDCANGAAYHIAPPIFAELGAEVISINTNPNGLNINKNCGALHPEKMQEMVKQCKADIGFAFDGDADRLVVCDESGKIIEGEFILGLLAKWFKENGMLRNNTLVTTMQSNLALDEFLNKEGIKVVRTAVGDRYVLQEMLRGNYSLGGESSGHIIFADYSTTGDGIISALQIMRILKLSKRKISELAYLFDLYPQIKINLPVKEKVPIKELKLVTEKIKEIENSLNNKGRVFVRYSGTEKKVRILVEGNCAKNELENYAQSIAEAFKKEGIV